MVRRHALVRVTIAVRRPKQSLASSFPISEVDKHAVGVPVEYVAPGSLRSWASMVLGVME